MTLLPGVYIAQKKDGTTYYRSSITYKTKHISLGSYKTQEEAHLAYNQASKLLNDVSLTIEDYQASKAILSFHKWVTLINFRDNNLYIRNPIYLKKKYFLYYLTQSMVLKFDADDLFYYSNHKIMQRGGYLFVSDYGMQVNILSRYGIKNFAVKEKDYTFCNRDDTDYRYGNIQIINRYYGVQKKQHGLYYEAKIHINGDFIVGKYKTEIEAAIAYNKAILILQQNNVIRNYSMNYIDEINEIEYASILNKVRVSQKIRSYREND